MPYTIQRIGIKKLSFRLPQRNSASTTHVFLGWLIDRAIYWTPHMLYDYRLAKVVWTLSGLAQKAQHTVHVPMRPTCSMSPTKFYNIT